MACNGVLVLGRVAMNLGDYSEAARQFERGLRQPKELGDAWSIASSYSHLGKVALLTQDYGKAKSWLQQSLIFHKQSGQQSRQYHEALCDVSKLLAADVRKEEAVKLLSVVQFQTQYQYVRDLATISLTELQTILPKE